MNTQNTTTPAKSTAASPKNSQIINGALLAYFLRKHRILLAVIAFCAAAYSVMIIALWPLFLDDAFQEGMESLAETFAAIAPDMDTGMFMMTLGQYLETQWLGVYWLPLAGAVLIVFAGKAIAGSISDGSLETICANPLKRVVYLNTIVVTLLIFSLVLSAATIVPLAALGPVFDAEMSVQTTAILLLAGWLIMFVFGLLVLAVSAWTRGVVLSAAVAVAFILVMIVLYVATPMVEFLEHLNPVNLLHWWGSAGIIDDGTAEPGLWIWLAVVGAITLAISYLGFLRRDLT